MNRPSSTPLLNPALLLSAGRFAAISYHTLIIFLSPLLLCRSVRFFSSSAAHSAPPKTHRPCPTPLACSTRPHAIAMSPPAATPSCIVDTSRGHPRGPPPWPPPSVLLHFCPSSSPSVRPPLLLSVLLSFCPSSSHSSPSVLPPRSITAARPFKQPPAPSITLRVAFDNRRP